LSSRWAAAAGTSAVAVSALFAEVDTGVVLVVVDPAFAALNIAVVLGNWCSIGCCWVHSDGPKEGCWVIVPSCRGETFIMTSSMGGFSENGNSKKTTTDWHAILDVFSRIRKLHTRSTN
jgi:hypothetical protein